MTRFALIGRCGNPESEVMGAACEDEVPNNDCNAAQPSKEEDPERKARRLMASWAWRTKGFMASKNMESVAGDDFVKVENDVRDDRVGGEFGGIEFGDGRVTAVDQLQGFLRSCTIRTEMAGETIF